MTGGAEGTGFYAATKHAVRAMTEALRQEVRCAGQHAGRGWRQPCLLALPPDVQGLRVPHGALAHCFQQHGWQQARAGTCQAVAAELPWPLSLEGPLVRSCFFAQHWSLAALRRPQARAKGLPLRVTAISPGPVDTPFASGASFGSDSEEETESDTESEGEAAAGKSCRCAVLCCLRAQLCFLAGPHVAPCARNIERPTLRCCAEGASEAPAGGRSRESACPRFCTP